MRFFTFVPKCQCGGDGRGSVTKSLTLATVWTVAHQAPLSTGFSRQQYCSGLPFPSPGGLPDPGIESRSPALQADSLPTELPGNSQYQCRRYYSVLLQWTKICITTAEDMYLVSFLQWISAHLFLTAYLFTSSLVDPHQTPAVLGLPSVQKL